MAGGIEENWGEKTCREKGEFESFLSQKLGNWKEGRRWILILALGELLIVF